jgi:hypothetical protein
MMILILCSSEDSYIELTQEDTGLMSEKFGNRLGNCTEWLCL